MHAGQRRTTFEPQGVIVSKNLDEFEELLRTDEEGDLPTIDHSQAVRKVGDELRHSIRNLVEPATIGALRVARDFDRANDAAVTRRVAGAGGRSPHTLSGIDATIGPLTALRGGVDLVGMAGIKEVAAVGDAIPGVRAACGAARGRLVTHRMSPFCSRVVLASRACFSLAASTSDMWPMSGQCWICSRILKTASMSMSGLGGQPGR